MSRIAKMGVALVQMKVHMNKTENIANALKLIRKAVKEAPECPKLVALPECFNTPYGTSYFREYAEEIPNGETCTQLSSIAKELKIFLVGGTIPEKESTSDKIFNTCTVWSPDGVLVGKHRKVHLFDIDVKGGVRFKESETLTGGKQLTIVKVDDFKIGIGICYDMRFEELARLYRNDGCDMLIYPGAFNMTTGPLHWELIQRSRANDLQLYVAGVSPARDVNFSYVAWGHSMVVDPWGKVIAEAKENEEIVYANIDIGLVDAVRSQIPTFSQRRTDIYDTIKKL